MEPAPAPAKDDLCTRCLQPVPQGVRRCPRCGEPITRVASATVFIALAGVLLLALVLMVLYLAVVKSEKPATPATDSDARVLTAPRGGASA